MIRRSGKTEVKNFTSKVVRVKPRLKTVAIKRANAKLVMPDQRYSRLYAIFGMTVLFVTSFYWSLLAVTVHKSNADQLVNTQLFENFTTYRGAEYPGAHTFLLKWPLFWLAHALGGSYAAIAAITICLVWVTLATFVYILRRINNKPFVFGSLMLALSSVLLFVPAQPYAGGILPVNMALLATRNIEYIIYIIGLILFVKAISHKNKKLYAASALLMTLLFASDKLFLGYMLGGAALALAYYVIIRHSAMRRVAMRFVLLSVVALTASSLVIWLLGKLGVHIIPNAAGPYSLITTIKEPILGSIFAGLGVLTNFGANPMYDAAVFRAMPGLLRSRLLTYGGLGFVVNGIILLVATRAAYVTTFKKANKEKKQHDLASDTPLVVSRLLVFTSLAAIGAFIVTKHYYVVDARYLQIILFTLFICLATYARPFTLNAKNAMGIRILCMIAIIFGLVFTATTYRSSQRALQRTEQRNQLVAEALTHYRVKLLVGDYWRVIPIKQLHTTLTILPLDGCTAKRQVLTSTAWNGDLDKTSFAYLISFDKSLTNFPSCTFKDVFATYGKPNASVLIDGKLDAPKEMVLIYESGAHKSEPITRKETLDTNTVVPVPLKDLPKAISCTNAPRIMNIVAHEDDDLLFLSPNLLHEVQAKSCMRTVYVTTGDAGQGKLYRIARENGSKAAYGTMMGRQDVWIEHIVKLANNQFITVAAMKGRPEISLLFMRIPDGDVRGTGFANTHFESLTKLEHGQIPFIKSIDDQSVYSYKELIGALSAVMNDFQPTELRTQAPYQPYSRQRDHSDHIAVSELVSQSFLGYDKNTSVALRHYRGYQIKDMLKNVTDSDLTQKREAFFAYANYDGSACTSPEDCSHRNLTYDAFLQRQYLVEN